jgi:dTDP-D-glucose 4,6-dehydratase
VHIDGPVGVRGRNSDNKLIREKLGWAPRASLRDGLTKTYPWIQEQVMRSMNEDALAVEASEKADVAQ